MRNKQESSRNKLALSIASAIALSVSSMLCAANSEPLQIDIESQSVGQALRALAKEANVQIVMPSELRNSFQAPSLKGEYTLEAALKKLIGESGLVYQFLSDTSVIVKDGEEIEEGDQIEVEEIVVTGTLIRNTPPASPVTVITRQDIDRMGLHSAEDIIRSLPQNFSSLNAGSSVNVTGSKDLVRAEDSQGNSGASLRGLGIDATLILVDGRRMAGSPIFEGNFINLSTIPAGAIERVEVLNDGASAIYGADAVAGVINFILRKDYVGSETSVRYENSANGGDGYSVKQLFGTSWDTGRATLTLSYDEQKAVSASKAGWTTQDQTSRGGSDRRSDYTQPGSIMVYNYLTGQYEGFSLPDGNDGTSWTAADLVPSEGADMPRKEATSTTNTTSASLRLQQEITDTFNVFLDALYSKNKTISESNPLTWGGWVPSTNAFNNYGGWALTQYAFLEEAESGLIPNAVPTSNVQQRFSVTTGFNWDLPYKDWRLTMSGSASNESSESEILTLNFGGRGYELSALTGIDVDGNPVPVDEQINLFGDGSVQSASLADYLVKRDNGSPDSILRSWNGVLEGALVSLPGGDLRFAVGGEYRYEQQDYSNNTGRGIDSAGFTYNDETREYEYFADESSVYKPDRTVKAAYTELSIPLFGEGNKVTGIESLLLTAAMRWEEYSYDDAASGSGQTFSNASPKLGMAWEPIADLRVRATWAESFRAPSFSEIIAKEDPYLNYPLTLYTGVRDPMFPNENLVADLIFGGNRNLKPETADSYTFGFDWTPASLDGLSVSATYSKIDFVDRITSLNYFIHPLDVIFALPTYAERGDDGRVTRINAYPVNVAGRESESVDVSINYQFETDAGTFDMGLVTVYTGTLNEILVEGDDPIVLDGTTNGPEKFKSRASLGWSREDFGANLFVNYSSSYKNNNGGAFFELLRETTSTVDHYVTMDLTGYYSLPESGWEIHAGVRNFLNKKFPFIDNAEGVPYDPARVDLRGRVIYMEVKKSFEF